MLPLLVGTLLNLRDGLILQLLMDGKSGIQLKPYPI